MNYLSNLHTDKVHLSQVSKDLNIQEKELKNLLLEKLQKYRGNSDIEIPEFEILTGWIYLPRKHVNLEKQYRLVKLAKIGLGMSLLLTLFIAFSQIYMLVPFLIVLFYISIYIYFTRKEIIEGEDVVNENTTAAGVVGVGMSQNTGMF